VFEVFAQSVLFFDERVDLVGQSLDLAEAGLLVSSADVVRVVAEEFLVLSFDVELESVVVLLLEVRVP